MSVTYKEGFIPFPPRPAGSIHPTDLGQYPGWVAQRKFNGTRTLIIINPDGKITMFTRHREPHKAYNKGKGPTDEMKAAIQSLPLEPGKFQMFDGELLHSKTRGIKDRVVLFDILVHDGEYLIGTSYEKRYDTLFFMLGEPEEYEDETGHKLALKINENIWLAETFTGPFEDRFRELLALDEIEGLVLKDPGGRLEPGVKEDNNTGWLIRCRKPHENYAF